MWASFGAESEVISSLSLRMQNATQLSNDYLITLETTGGAIDGYPFRELGLEAHAATDAASGSLLHACGHFVNHPNIGESPNCDVVDFMWREALGDNHEAEISADSLLPSCVNPVANGLWVIDAMTGERHNTDGSSSYSTGAPNSLAEVSSPRPSLAGLALVATRPIEPGEQLLLDYKLQPPYPPWWLEGSL